MSDQPISVSQLYAEDAPAEIIALRPPRDPVAAARIRREQDARIRREQDARAQEVYLRSPAGILAAFRSKTKTKTKNSI